MATLVSLKQHILLARRDAAQQQVVGRYRAILTLFEMLHAYFAVYTCTSSAATCKESRNYLLGGDEQSIILARSSFDNGKASRTFSWSQVSIRGGEWFSV